MPGGIYRGIWAPNKIFKYQKRIKNSITIPDFIGEISRVLDI